MREEIFYKPIKNYFEDVLAKDLGLSIQMVESNKSIPKKIRKEYPDIYRISNTYSYNPDLIGIISANKKREEKRLLIVEVKGDPIRLKDLYQTKRYSEIIKADCSFLLSPGGFARDDEQLIKTDKMEHISNYYLRINNKIFIKKIIIGKINYRIKNKQVNIHEIVFDNSFDLL